MRGLLGSILEKQNETIQEIRGTKEFLAEKMDRMNENLGEKMDRMLDKQDETIKGIGDTKIFLGEKMDGTLDKQDETILEIKDMNRDLKDKSDIEGLKGDVAEIKNALRAKGII
ncbi:Uncharacterised protein [uncultured archaeon]|nr:Uncharacterised protein [uncultured archaeon]